MSARRKKNKTNPLTETETETDADALLSIERQKEALAKSKTKSKQGGKGLKNVKRWVVGFFLIAELFLPVYLGPVYHTINAYIFGLSCFREITSL
jgi:hypothetical protein